MTSLILPPSYVSLDALVPTMRKQGYAVLDAATVLQWMELENQQLAALQTSWDDLASDEYLKDGGRYRQRRHACYRVLDHRVQRVPHRAHWQPVEYNALHGGMQRWFEPIKSGVVDAPAMLQLLVALAELCSQIKGQQTWFTEAHQFRIDTSDGIGRPTPEGAHRDGVDLVAVFLVNRHDVKGGETRVFAADGPHGQRFTLTQAWSLLLLDDARVIHESTPIQPVVPGGYRDTLVITLRSHGFQGDD